jgi:4-amino-4-deoxy-L-arabinose transferase-like glycosyltransferase
MKNRLLYSALIIVTLLGAVLRTLSISPYKLYPDAYQNLIVAENIRTYHQVVGYLGDQGMRFPPFFMWSRPSYPLLINTALPYIGDSTTAAHAVSYILGVAAIPLSYIFIKQLFSSTGAGLGAALLLSTSFGHTVWSGYILTETTGIFLLLLVLTLITGGRNTDRPWTAIGAGIVFGCAVLARYEYIVLSIPISIFIITSLQSPRKHAALFIISAGILLLATVTYLFPVRSTIGIFVKQSQHVLKGASYLSVAIVCTVIFALLPRQYKKLLSAVVAIVIIIAFTLGAPSLVPSLGILTGTANFVAHDVFLVTFALLGFLGMCSRPANKWLAYGVIASVILLYSFYFAINPYQMRYWTHTMPLLLIPASYVFSRPLKKYSWNTSILATVLIAYQIYITAGGIRQWNNGDWTQKSYEETAAGIVNQKNYGEHTLVIASFPEPYYYITRLSTESISDTYPYIFPAHQPDNPTVLLIYDEGMRDLFPQFSQVIEKKLAHYKTDEFWTGRTYHYADRSHPETQPISLYKISYQDLTQMIYAN